MFAVLYWALNHLLSSLFWSAARGRLQGSALFLGTAATLAAALIAGGALVNALDGRRTGSLGFAWTRSTPRELLSGFGLGGVALIAAALFMLLTGALRYGGDNGTIGTWGTTLLWHMLIFMLAAAAEEAVYRGYGFQALVRGFGVWPAALGTSVMFAVAHSSNPNVTGFALLNITIAGVLLGLAYLRTMSLWFATAVHAGWNWTMASLLDLPVSGLTSFDAPLYEPSIGGISWMSGGSFGPEGGVAGTIGLMVGIVLLFHVMKLRPAPEMLALRPIAADERGSESS